MNSKNKLEQFIEKNINEFDAYEPSPSLWKKIEQNLDPKGNNIKVVNFSLSKIHLGWAAAFLILFTASVAIYFIALEDNTNPYRDFAKINPDYATEATQFASLIEIKRSELKRLETENPELYKAFSEEIKQLESSYTNLKSQLTTTPNQELLIQELIKNLQLQIDLLNKQLAIIQKINNYKKEKNETSNI